jgi:hypothetical protein
MKVKINIKVKLKCLKKLLLFNGYGQVCYNIISKMLKMHTWGQKYKYNHMKVTILFDPNHPEQTLQVHITNMIPVNHSNH